MTVNDIPIENIKDSILPPPNKNPINPGKNNIVNSSPPPPPNAAKNINPNETYPQISPNEMAIRRTGSKETFTNWILLFSRKVISAYITMKNIPKTKIYGIPIKISGCNHKSFASFSSLNINCLEIIQFAKNTVKIMDRSKLINRRKTFIFKIYASMLQND